MRPKLALVVTAGALAVAVTMVLAACGGDSDGVASLSDTTGQSADDSTTASNGDSSADEQDPQEAALAFARCMREHGVDMPDPQNGELRLSIGPNDDPQKVEEAQQACQGLLEGARPQLTEEQQSVMQEGFLAFAKCMREHGIDMPDPQFGEGGTFTQRAGPRSNFNPDDPDFQEAQKACEPILEEARREAGLPERPGGGSFRRSGGGS